MDPSLKLVGWIRIQEVKNYPKKYKKVEEISCFEVPDVFSFQIVRWWLSWYRYLARLLAPAALLGRIQTSLNGRHKQRSGKHILARHVNICLAHEMEAGSKFS
jgi:hypothetical protein